MQADFIQITRSAIRRNQSWSLIDGHKDARANATSGEFARHYGSVKISRIAVSFSLVIVSKVIYPTFALAEATAGKPAATTVYYISPHGDDGNPGTMASPWRTIQKAANTVSAGDTAVLLDGVYEEGSVNISRSGSAGAPITFKAQNKWQAVLSSTSGCNPGISIKASYITVKDIRFSVSPNNVQCRAYSSSNVAIRAWNSVDPTPSNPTTGYVGFIADGIKVDAGSQRSEGVKSNQDFTVIENSESGNALELFNNKDSIIRNNVIVGQDPSGTSILAKGGVRNIQIYNNVIHNKARKASAVALGGYSCDACFFDAITKIEAYNSVAYNNVVINESGGNMMGLVLEGAKNSAFFNNVVIGGQLSMAPGGRTAGHQAATENPTFKNNIVICDRNSVALNGSYAGLLTIDSNTFHNCSKVPAQAHPRVGEPLFVNPASVRNHNGQDLR
jgi:hypothetical protein